MDKLSTASDSIAAASHPHFWWTVEVGFTGLCILATSLFVIWMIGIAIGSYVEGQQERARRRRRMSNYQVGGVINP